MPYLVTLKAGLVDVMLPNGLRVQGGDVALLTDSEYSLLSSTSITNLFSTTAAVNTASAVPATSISSQAPTISGSTIGGTWVPNNPYTEQTSGEPSTSTTPLNTPYTQMGP